ncbi:MAG: hypothetical protein HQL58_13590 [Magnetococcales bacterium]|nr:hypothetical protein [Magnetococcales bacterium]
MLIYHIDAIARRLKRDVLLVTFHKPSSYLPDDEDDRLEPGEEVGSFEFCEQHPIRMKLIDFLDSHRIEWQPCASWQVLGLIESYQGQLFIDVPYHEDNEDYQKVCAFLEHTDGSPRYKNVKLWIMPLSVAIKNAHFDDPDFSEEEHWDLAMQLDLAEVIMNEERVVLSQLAQ